MAVELHGHKWNTTAVKKRPLFGHALLNVYMMGYNMETWRR
jgi:hypothetical protein